MMVGGKLLKHKFQADSHMTFQQVYDFVFKDNIPVFRDLARELGEEHFLKVLKKVALDDALRSGQEDARRLPVNDFASYNA